jgi:hypothetical protein
MRRAEGTCIHCSKYVVREPDGTLVASDDGWATCGDFCEPNPEDHQLDDEEDD